MYIYIYITNLSCLPACVSLNKSLCNKIYTCFICFQSFPNRSRCPLLRSRTLLLTLHRSLCTLTVAQILQKVEQVNFHIRSRRSKVADASRQVPIYNITIIQKLMRRRVGLCSQNEENFLLWMHTGGDAIVLNRQNFGEDNRISLCL